MLIRNSKALKALILNFVYALPFTIFPKNVLIIQSNSIWSQRKASSVLPKLFLNVLTLKAPL